MDWFKANKLTLNLDKTVCVLFNNKTKTKEITLDIGTHKLHNSEIVKFLGVWIDDKMTWTKHVSTLMVKLKQNMHLLKLSNKFLTKNTKKLIYYAHIYSHLTYGILIWGKHDKSNDKEQNTKSSKYLLQSHNRTGPYTNKFQERENVETARSNKIGK